MATGQSSHQDLEEARNGVSPTASRGAVELLMASAGLLASRNVKG